MRNRTLSVLTTSVFAALALASIASADDLKRRGMMGVMLAPLNADAQQRLKSPDSKGVLITGVVPASAADKAGVKGEDILVRINDQSVANIADLMKTMRRFGGGDTLKFTVLREGAETTMELTLNPRPMEQPTDYDVIYDSAGESGKRVRTIITRPKEAKKSPAIMFVQVLSPLTMETGSPGPHLYRGIINELTKAGYVTMRVERLGMGDSDGADINETTVDQDIAAFKSALTKLKTYEYVDPANIFIVGHSTGGMIVPQIAQSSGVKGVITYGAFARSLKDNTLDETQRIAKFNLQPEAEAAANLEKMKTFVAEVYEQKKSPRDVLAAHPDFKEFVEKFVQEDEYIDRVHYKYMQQLAALKPAEAWSKVDAPVLALWGEADFIASKADGELIASTVNASHAGKATFTAVPKADHMFSTAADQEESFLAGTPGQFNPTIVETISKWIRERTGQNNS